MGPMGPMTPMGTMVPPPAIPGEPLPGFDGKMLRKSMARKTVDYNSSTVKYLEVNIFNEKNASFVWVYNKQILF